jgi:ATP-dependent helicase/nuclease subunit B
VRRLDLKLRGPRPAPGLAGIAGHLREGWTATWWSEEAVALASLERVFGAGAQPLAALVACLRETAQSLCGDALWAGPAGRAASELLAELEAEAPAGPPTVDPQVLPALLRTLLDETAVRPPQGGHPRLAIHGLIEARLQTADLLILGGLNEGVWPGTPAPDPWLAPRIRAELGLPGLERRIGVAAHDFAQGLGAPQVLLTRARRDARSPTLASRFWLRLAAMAGVGFEEVEGVTGWVRSLDDPGEHTPVERPEPLPPSALRPKVISVTEVDRLKADPYAFYARRILGLRPLDAVDADPSPADRGNAVHDILEHWVREDGCRVERLRERALAMLHDKSTHPMLRALWQPRLMAAIEWIAGQIAGNEAEGRRVASAEGKGRIEIARVTLSGRYDRIDRFADGSIAIIDYKTGKPPSAAAVRAGYSLQLGLLGMIAERGGFPGVRGTASAFEYWSLGKSKEGFGYAFSPVDPAGVRDKIVTGEFASVAADNFTQAVGEWLTGTRAFTAKLVPEYAPYAEYDQLMRRDEWYGRD